MRTSETSVAAWRYHEQMVIRTEIARRHSNESAAWGKFTEGELLLGIPCITLARRWLRSSVGAWGTAGGGSAVPEVPARSPCHWAIVLGQPARAGFVGPPARAVPGSCSCHGFFPGFHPQHKQHYKNEVLVLSVPWIDSVAPFFFFSSGDFEKGVLKYTHSAAGLWMIVEIFISFSHGFWAGLLRQIWQVRFWPLYVLFSAQVAQDFFFFFLSDLGFVCVMALGRIGKSQVKVWSESPFTGCLKMTHFTSPSVHVQINPKIRNFVFCCKR